MRIREDASSVFFLASHQTGFAFLALTFVAAGTLILSLTFRDPTGVLQGSS